MDWYLAATHEAASNLRPEVRDYLERHAVEGADVDGAELAFSELLTNAVEHSENHVWVSIDWAEARPVVTVNDLGPGFELEADPPPGLAHQGRGLMIASHLTDQLSVGAKRAGGNRVTAVLPIERAEDSSYGPAVAHRGMLPDRSEARDGYFPREPFLRALAVELAHVVDLEHGPAAAERAIAQVGGSVGDHMEAVYRDQKDLVGPMSTAEVADLYVGLKAGIGGDFYVISADAERIVLGNRRCPFGDAVKHAPSLCRMTSSVFGGIAARNRDSEVAVHLEERIAVGDPECRVIVWLESPPPEVQPFVHRYRGEMSG